MNKHAYMIVTEAGNPVTISHLLPIYWRKPLAEKDAKEICGGARVVRIPMPKEDAGAPS